MVSLFIKENKVVIKSLYELKGHNTHQFMMEFPVTQRLERYNIRRLQETMVQSTDVWAVLDDAVPCPD